MPYDPTEADLYILLAGARGCSLASTPEKDNWVDDQGGLPNYICRIARAIKRGGKHSTSSAIAMAVSQVKKWAAGGDDVDADTRAKAAAAVAEWTSMKAKAKGKKASLSARSDGSEYVALSGIGSFNTDMVRDAFYARQRPRHSDGPEEHAPSEYVMELWTDFVVVECNTKDGRKYLKYPYTVEGLRVTFGEPVEVSREWTEAGNEDLTTNEMELLAGVLTLKASSPLEAVMALLEG